MHTVSLVNSPRSDRFGQRNVSPTICCQEGLRGRSLEWHPSGGLGPQHFATAQEEVTSTSRLSPDRWRQSRFVESAAEHPSWTRTRRHRQLDVLAASAGTSHCGEPEIAVFPDEIQHTVLHIVWRIRGSDCLVSGDSSPQARPQPTPSPVDNLEHAHSPIPGMPRKGTWSPVPTMWSMAGHTAPSSPCSLASGSDKHVRLIANFLLC